MRKRFSSNLGTGINLPSWPAALIGIVVIKAVLSLAVKPGSFLLEYGGISYIPLLVLATGFSLRNAIQNTLDRRPFWVFLSIAYSLWGLNHFFGLYYQLVLHVLVPSNSIADSLLFLHVVPLMAAVASFPQQSVPQRSLSPAILNFLLLLFIWGFIYGYIVFPYQYLYSTSSYGLRFDILYLLENVTLVVAVGLLTIRSQPPWKLIYSHLLGASTLYALSSGVGNLAIDSGGYVNGKLYELGLAASVCWFVWIPLQARQVAGGQVIEIRAKDSKRSRSSLWPMLLVVLVSIPIVWELFRRSEIPGLRTLRLFIAVAALVCLASAAYLKEHLARRAMASQVDEVNDRLRLAMQAGSWVGWDLDVKSGRDLWFGDLYATFGIPSDNHAATVEEFLRCVHPDDRQRVSAALADARQNGRPYAQEFRILRQDGTIRWLAAQGKFYFSANGQPVRMVGVSLDISERKLAEDRLREYEKAVEFSEEMIAVVDRDYRYLIANRKFLRLRNMTKEQVVGHLASEVLNKGVFEAEVRDKLDQCLLGNIIRYEMKYTYPELGERDVLISYFPIEGPSGIDRVACIVQDITDRKRLEKVLAGMSRKLIEAQEHERSRISQELHDDINQRLAILANEVEKVRQDPSRLPSQVRARLFELQKDIVEISNDVHSLAYELRSPHLEYLGVVGTLKSFCREFAARHTVEIEFTHDDIPVPVPPDVSLCLFRILQEALHNASKHSKVRHFEVKLSCRQNQLQLTVRDRGIGFYTEEAMTKGGLGLLSMRERVRLVNGNITIQSKPMSGTTINVRVPFTSEDSSVQAIPNLPLC